MTIPIPPGYEPIKPVANAWNKQNPLMPYLLGVCAMAIGAAVTLAFVAREQQAKQSQTAEIPHSTITIETSTGGSRHDTGKTDGSDIALAGQNVSADDLHLDHTLISFDGLSIMGGGVAASFKVSGKTLELLRWLCIALAIPCLISGTVKWLAKDYIHAIGQGLCAIGLILAAMDPDLLAWFGLAAVACILISHWFPSATAKAQKALEDYVKTAEAIVPEAAAKVKDNLDAPNILPVTRAGL